MLAQPESKQPARRASKVAMCPHFVINPYQKLLQRSLEQLGCRFDLVRTHFELARLVKSRPAVLHLHWPPIFQPGLKFKKDISVFFLALLILRLRGTRIVWTIHNAAPHESQNRKADILINKLLGRIAHASICHSPHAKARAASAFRLKEGAVHVVEHGNYIGHYPNEIGAAEARSKLGLAPDAPVVLFLGLVRPYKGVLELIESFRAAAPKDSYLLVAGKLQDMTEQEIQRQVAGDGRIKLFLGHIADSDLQLYFNASDVVAFPYRDSLTSGAAILAMSFGKACIAYRHDGMVSILDEKGSLLADPHAPGTLAAAIAAALDDREFLRSAGAWNLRKCRSWSWSKVAQETKAIYDGAHPANPLV